MKLKPIVQPALAGTALMTSFSYLASACTGRNFKEPELLARIVAGKPRGPLRAPELVLGWLGHAGAGISWQLLFRHLMENRGMRPSLKNGMVLGALTGVASVLIWSSMFRASRNRVLYRPGRFYRHLVLAHIVFGIAALKTEPKDTPSGPTL